MVMIEIKSKHFKTKPFPTFKKFRNDSVSFCRNYLMQKQEDNKTKHLGPMRIIQFSHGCGSTSMVPRC